MKYTKHPLNAEDVQINDGDPIRNESTRSRNKTGNYSMNIRNLKPTIDHYQEMQACAKQLAKAARGINGDFSEIYDVCRASNNFRPSQKRSELKFLWELIRQNRTRTICEIGTLRGGTLFMFSQAAPDDAKILSVDINSTFTRRQALRKFQRGAQQLKIIEGDSQSSAVENRVRAEFREMGVDFLFIDGDHSLFGVLNDFVRYSPLVKPGGIIALHDIHPDSFMRTGVKTDSWVGGVPYFWEFVSKIGYRTDQFIEDSNQDGFGIGIIYKE